MIGPRPCAYARSYVDPVFCSQSYDISISTSARRTNLSCAFIYAYAYVDPVFTCLHICLCLCLCLCASETVYVFGPLLATVVNRPFWFDFPKLPLPVSDCALNLLILGTRSLKVWLCWHHSKREGGVLGLIFAGYVLQASQSPYPIIVYSVTTYSKL